MVKDKKNKYIKIAHERNAKNIEEHQAAKVAAEEKKKVSRKTNQPTLSIFRCTVAYLIIIAYHVGLL